MDFVLRDAYMSGFSPKAFDLDRLLHYSFFSEQGLTIARRGLGSLLRFMAARSELFQNVYFHRTVRAIDLSLADVFPASREFLFPGNPLDHLDEYLEFTETSLLVDVSRWRRSSNPRQAELGQRWHELLSRRVPWRMACQRSLLFSAGDAESSSIFSDPLLVEAKLRRLLVAAWKDVPLKVDVARHIYRPHAQARRHIRTSFTIAGEIKCARCRTICCSAICLSAHAFVASIREMRVPTRRSRSRWTNSSGLLVRTT